MKEGINKWVKTGTKILANGEKNIQYSNGDYPGILIESRKRAIPHSGGTGYWMHTTYFVIKGGKEKEYWSLREAIRAAEEGAK